MPFLYFDWTFWLVVPAFVFALWAQHKVRSSFDRYSRVRSASGYTGAQIARELLRRAEVAAATEQAGAARGAEALGAVNVEMTPGQLTDHYDPSQNVLRLSEPVYGSDSIAAIGVAAHETGHAIQQATGYGGVAMRSALVPMAQFGSKLALPLFFVGLIFGGGQGGGLSFLMDIGILLYVAAVAFTLVTLPVEYDASRRAVTLLRDGGYVSAEELPYVKRVLGAAALTYVAAVAVAVLTLVRLLILRGERD
ncbi:MAG: zinc metallopeptidase [Armatimonadota bacterium]|nr:MAG: zinc metallopeptidase [Armatimonadota bacterium]